jgi:hypothetical protein
MFAYRDPSGTLKPAKALANYRSRLHAEYRQHAKLAGSAFTLLEAFAEVSAPKQRIDTVRWIAFPKTAQAPNATIDADRFGLQDEYVEWRVERDAAGAVAKVTFTTEFLEYYEALAMASHTALVAGVKAVIPGAAPTVAELYGPNFTPTTAVPEARARAFRGFAQDNPWNDGRKGILCLGQQFNTLGALFNLGGRAAVPKPNLPVGSVCASLGGFCGPARNSDPSIASAIQTLARAGRGLAFADPVGIVLDALGGIWRIGNTQIDVNDPAANQGVWTITRGGRRAVLTVVPGLKLDDEAVESGAQVASVLSVMAQAVSAAEADLPAWSRVGQEQSQRLDEIANAGAIV